MIKNKYLKETTKQLIYMFEEYEKKYKELFNQFGGLNMPNWVILVFGDLVSIIFLELRFSSFGTLIFRRQNRPNRKTKCFNAHPDAYENTSRHRLGSTTGGDNGWSERTDQLEAWNSYDIVFSGC